MTGYLIAEEGPLEGLVISFEEGSEWILGRDPDEASIVLEDPMVSRKHIICHRTDEGFTLENLSAINPATQNGKVITEEVLLKENDILEIGSTFFRFTEKKPLEIPTELDDIKAEEIIESSTLFEEEDPLPTLNFEVPPPSKWLLKVISGPNAGAEFDLSPGVTYSLGKDPNVCDVVFYDLSVSKQHAKLSVDENELVFIEDLESLNGVLLNGERIELKQEIFSQDLLALGTTSFLMIDREQVNDTIFTPTTKPTVKEEKIAEMALDSFSVKKLPVPDRNWKDLVIPQKHLVLGGVFALLILTLITASFSLFTSNEIEIPTLKEKSLVSEALNKFSSVQFSLNEATGKLFLIGHVLTKIEKQELSYTLSTLPFITSIEDTVIIDELVWQNMNAILLTYPNWQAVSIHSPSPGKFVMKGYVQTPEEAELLADYMNVTFPYLNLLDNQVNVANTLTLQVETIFLQYGFRSIAFNLSGGDLLVTGNIDKRRASDFDAVLKEIKKLPGIVSLKNFTVYLSATESHNSTVDISTTYSISGFSSGDNDLQFAIINKKIFETGDVLDGMLITAIEADQVLLEKDGIKFKINYNLQ